MPIYPGGDDALRKFIAKNVTYPDYAKKNGISGKVYVNFVVEKDGSVGRMRIVRGVDPSLDAEALRGWRAKCLNGPRANNEGNRLLYQYTIPINFALQ